MVSRDETVNVRMMRVVGCWLWLDELYQRGCVTMCVQLALGDVMWKG